MKIALFLIKMTPIFDVIHRMGRVEAKKGC